MNTYSLPALELQEYPTKVNGSMPAWQTIEAEPLLQPIGSGVEFSTFLEDLEGLPVQTGALGICADGLPVLFDLTDPAPGSLLVSGSIPEDTLHLLKIFSYTAAAFNSPAAVQICVLSANPDLWYEDHFLAQVERNFSGIYGLYDRDAEIQVLRMAELARARKLGRQSAPAILLVIDDLAATSQFDMDARINLEWLLRVGPEVKIWPVAAVGSYTSAVKRLYRDFNTCIYSAGYRPFKNQSVDDVLLEGEFAVSTGDGLLKFGLPRIH